MDVTVKEGMLYLQGVKFGKRTWRKVWMVLIKPSSTGVGRLELYNVTCDSAVADQKKAGNLKAPERKVVRLSDCLSVTPAPKESCPSQCTAFYLNTTMCTHTLASDTSQDWISALCLLAFQKDPGESSKGDFDRGNNMTMEENDLYSTWSIDGDLPPNTYKVTVQSTEASKRCKLSGDFLISPDSEAVMLLGVGSSSIIYRWPYRMIRKFGQVEGGFSIEAGRRCDSGQGLFIFLSKQGPEIFQVISRQCLEKTTMMQQLNVHRRSLSDQTPVTLPKPTKQPATPPARKSANVSDESVDDSANHYSTINHFDACKRPSLVRAHLTNSREAVGGKTEEEDERCQSLEAEDVDNAEEDGIYYNLQRAVPVRVTDKLKPEVEGSQCIYSCLKHNESSLNPPLQPSSSALPPLPPPPLPPPPPPPPPPCTLSSPPPKPRLQPPASNSVQPGYNAVDNMKEIEEAISSTCHVTPTETPGSFKHKLAAIISKDLAKLQQPLPPGAGGLTFSQ